MQKEQRLHTEHGFDILLTICKSHKSFCIILCFRKEEKNLNQFFYYKIQMGDECEKQLTFGIPNFDRES